MSDKSGQPKKTILILGNGLSRLAFDAAIRSFKDADKANRAIWACNRAYLDFSDILDALAGHADVMEEARDAGVTCKIFGINEALTCAPVFQKDTGTTLVAEALTRGYDVIVCGFDLGGADCYSPGHEKKNKTTWVERWRLILKSFGADRVTFWGYDHKPFILSDRPANEYAREYTRGRAHIPTEEYQKTLDNWTDDYSRIWVNVPLVYLKNIGGRDWSFKETPEELKQGGKIKLPECVARKYAEAYKRDFVLEPVLVDMVV